jgi:hypothetical protein
LGYHSGHWKGFHLDYLKDLHSPIECWFVS